MALSRRERMACLRALRLAEEYYSLLIRQPIMDRAKTNNCQGVIRALKLSIQHDRATLFPAAPRCPTCGSYDRAGGVDEGGG